MHALARTQIERCQTADALYKGNLASDIGITLTVTPDHWKPIGEHLPVNHGTDV